MSSPTQFRTTAKRPASIWLGDELPLAADIEEVAEEVQLEDHDRIDRRLTGPAVVRSRQAANKFEVDDGGDLAQDVMAGNSSIEREADESSGWAVLRPIMCGTSE